MKWSDKQISQLRELAFAEKSNSEIAKALNIDINEVYAKRSQLGITIPKVRAMKGQPAMTVNPEFEKAAQEMDGSVHKQIPADLKAAFKALQNELLLTMARNRTTPEEAKQYAAISDIVSLAQETLERWIRDE